MSIYKDAIILALASTKPDSPLTLEKLVDRSKRAANALVSGQVLMRDEFKTELQTLIRKEEVFFDEKKGFWINEAKNAKHIKELRDRANNPPKKEPEREIATALELSDEEIIVLKGMHGRGIVPARTPAHMFVGEKIKPHAATKILKGLVVKGWLEGIRGKRPAFKEKSHKKAEVSEIVHSNGLNK